MKRVECDRVSFAGITVWRLSTLQRQLKRPRLDKIAAKEGGRLVAVKLAGRQSNGNSGSSSALEVVLCGGHDAELVRLTLKAEGVLCEITCLQGREEFVTVRRIEVRPGFEL